MCLLRRHPCEHNANGKQWPSRITLIRLNTRVVCRLGVVRTSEERKVLRNHGKRGTFVVVVTSYSNHFVRTFEVITSLFSFLGRVANFSQLEAVRQSGGISQLQEVSKANY